MAARWPSQVTIKEKVTMLTTNNILAIGAIAGAVVAAVFFILANGQDTEWGLASFAISWGLYLISGTVRTWPGKD